MSVDTVPNHLWNRVQASDPRDDLVAQHLAEAPPDAPVALLGVPFDGAVLGRRGARHGPRAIREHLGRLKLQRFSDGGGPGIQVRDAGDVPVEDADGVLAVHDLVSATVAALREDATVPVALGGDHSLTYPLVRPHAEAMDLAVVNLDAHLDVREVPPDGEPNSGTSFGRLLREGLVEGSNLAEVGVRDHATSTHYAEFAQDEGVHLVPAAEARAADPRELAQRILEPLEADGVYLSVDLDVLDQAHAPGVSAPTPGGLSTGELLDLVDALLDAVEVPVVGVDVVELAPRLDEGARSTRAAAYVTAHVLAGLTRRIQDG